MGLGLWKPERNIRCDSKRCRRVGGIKGRSQRGEMLLFNSQSKARMQHAPGKGKTQGSTVGNSAKTKQAVSRKVKGSLFTKDQEKKSCFISINYIKK